MNRLLVVDECERRLTEEIARPGVCRGDGLGILCLRDDDCEVTSSRLVDDALPVEGLKRGATSQLDLDLLTIGDDNGAGACKVGSAAVARRLRLARRQETRDSEDGASSQRRDKMSLPRFT